MLFRNSGSKLYRSEIPIPGRDTKDVVYEYLTNEEIALLEAGTVITEVMVSSKELLEYMDSIEYTEEDQRFVLSGNNLFEGEKTVVKPNTVSV